jgi:REP element-mobilizing transposase RayT
MLESWWVKLPGKFPAVETDAFVVMPNHLHGIIALVEGAERPTLGTVVPWYKTMTTYACIQGVKEHGWPPFHTRLWQRNYWEHIVRDDADLARLM